MYGEEANIALADKQLVDAMLADLPELTLSQQWDVLRHLSRWKRELVFHPTVKDWLRANAVFVHHEILHRSYRK